MRIFYFSLLLLATSPAFSQTSSPQRFLDAGLIAGLNNYSGDVAEKTFVLKETRLGFGAFARYHFSSQFALKAQFFFSNIGGTDANARDAEIKERSLKFNSNLLEGAILGEWNFMNIKTTLDKGIQDTRVVPYLLLGIGGVVTHPEISYYGPPGEYDIHVRYPLPESGHLSEKAMIIPFGAGIRVQIDEFVMLGGEGCWRPVLSDLLDGVSLNGNSQRRDWYFGIQFTASFIISNKSGSVKP